MGAVAIAFSHDAVTLRRSLRTILFIQLTGALARTNPLSNCMASQAGTLQIAGCGPHNPNQVGAMLDVRPATELPQDRWFQPQMVFAAARLQSLECSDEPDRFSTPFDAPHPVAIQSRRRRLAGAASHGIR